MKLSRELHTETRTLDPPLPTHPSHTVYQGNGTEENILEKRTVFKEEFKEQTAVE